MTAIGSGAAMSQTKSHSPRSHTASISVSHSVPIDCFSVLHALAGEAGVDELAPQQMCRVVHLDHHRRRGLVGPDAARVGEQLGLRARRRSPPGRSRRRPSRCGPGRPARSRASTCRPSASRRRRRRRRSDRRPAWLSPSRAAPFNAQGVRHRTTSRRSRQNSTTSRASASPAMQVPSRRGDHRATFAHHPADSATPAKRHLEWGLACDAVAMRIGAHALACAG